MKKTILSIIVLIAVIFGVRYLLTLKPNNQDMQNEETALEDTNKLTMIILAEGRGDIVLTQGDIAVVNYTGTLVDGTVFDSSIERGPFEFPFGSGAVIQGWDIGLRDMKIGEKRRLIVPSSMAYGENGIGPIPPNSTLIFDVELLEIKKTL